MNALTNPQQLRILQRHAQQMGWHGIDWREFLDPSPPIINRLGELPGIQTAIQRLHQALLRNQRIVLFGDYDVDGITSVTQLVKVLGSTQCAKVEWIIPDRNVADYGLDSAAVDQILSHQEKPNVVVTLDCGSNSIQEIQRLTDVGVDVIVIDHHQTHGTTPHPSIAHLNPKAHQLAEPANTDLRRLCTAGLVYLFSELLLEGLQIRDFPLHQNLALACLGTIADAVELQGTNRNLVKRGLRIIADNQHTNEIPGLCSLLENNEAIKAQSLAFLVAPKLNATGRLAKADIAVELLLAKNKEDADRLGVRCTELNDQRKLIQQKITDQAQERAKAALQRKPDRGVILLYDEGWHPSVVGIVAGRVKDIFQRSTILLGKHSDGNWRGSGRNFGSLDLGAIANQLVKEGIVKRAGGHRQAIGIKAAPEQLPGLDAWLEQQCAVSTTEPIKIDYIGDWDELPPSDWVEIYEQLEPFGQGNPKPVLRATAMHFQGPAQPLLTKATKDVWAIKAKFRGPSRKEVDVITKDITTGMTQWTPNAVVNLDLEVSSKDYGGRTFFNWTAVRTQSYQALSTN